MILSALAGRRLITTWLRGGYEVRARIVSFSAVGVLAALTAAGLGLGVWLSSRNEPVMEQILSVGNW
jgi:hypothetical protein